MSVRPAKTQNTKDPSFLHADSEDSDQTGRTVTLLVLSCRGSVIARMSFLKLKRLKDVHSFVIRALVLTYFLWSE